MKPSSSCSIFVLDMSEGRKTSRERISDLLTSWEGGDSKARDRLFTALYQDLRRVARHQLRRRQGGGTLDTTGLIHEAYIRLVRGSTTGVRSRGHFLALASRVMRQVVVDYARGKGAAKRGAGLLCSLPGDTPLPIQMKPEDLLALDEALHRLEAIEPRAARLVELRYFGGLSIEEAAKALSVSVGTVKRDWLRARAFLYEHMKEATQS
jgi:RNA polymerase sigma factor (TIGR02999 family)